MNAYVSIIQTYTEKSGFDVYMHGLSHIHIPTILIASASITLLNNTNSALLIKSAIHCPSNHQYADCTRTQRSVGCLQKKSVPKAYDRDHQGYYHKADWPPLNMNLKKTMFRYMLCRFQSECLEMPHGVA
ncbi:hypothetical protein VNO77_08010 [Canavalia gladiata]|uniref:Uncharacterized protein n=1 Tax=Canavalia gladiata TaxID=3824 RepID=A0AAN9M830_CANGL